MRENTKSNHCGTEPRWQAAWKTPISGLLGLALLLAALPAAAGQSCWPAKQVIERHTRQGDEIILTYRSWMQDGAATVIYLDPADGVVTEITLHPDGTACVIDVGTGLRLQAPGKSAIPQTDSSPRF